MVGVMGLAIRYTSRRMTPQLRDYHAQRQEQRLKGAERAGASWAHRTLRGGMSQERTERAAQRAAELWHERHIQERCDAYLAGLYD